MAGPVPTYLSTQLAAQTAFTVSFGLLTLVNGAITAATAAGQFNVTVDCSLFTAEDVSNLRVYLDSLGYNVEFAKNTSNKSLNIDWGSFLDIPGTEVIVDQGTSPWIVAGTVAATQSGPWTVSLTSGSIEIGTVDQGHAGSESWLVDVTNIVSAAITNFPAVQTVNVNNFPATQPVSGTVTALQGTSPWVTSVSNFPATIAVTQSTSPWVVSGTVTANAGTGNFTVVQPTGANLHVDIDNFPATQPVSGTVTALQGTSPWVVSGTITANAGTGTFLVDGSAHTQPVSGTVTANIGTADGISTSANQTNGSQKSQIVDGANATVGPVQTIGGTNYLPVVLAASGTPGATVPTRAVQVAGSDGTNLQSISVTSTGVVNTTRVGGTMNTGQVSIGSTSTLILAANANRKRLVLVNMGTTNVFIGNSGVTIGTGQLLLGIAGYPIPVYFTGNVYGIVGTGTQTIAYLEEAV